MKQTFVSLNGGTETEDRLVQPDSAFLCRTCGRAMARKHDESEFVFLERAQSWLEKEDTVFARSLGYAVCCFAVIYLVGNIIRMILY